MEVPHCLKPCLHYLEKALCLRILNPGEAEPGEAADAHSGFAVRLQAALRYFPWGFVSQENIPSLFYFKLI